MQTVRPPAVAGMFYPAPMRALRAEVARCLDDARRADAPRPAADPSVRPKLLVVPHAGYVYSGAVAARAYVRLEPWRASITRVVLIGPAHRMPVTGLAAPRAEAFETPLGRVPVDQAALAALAGLPQVAQDDAPHAAEHALEVQLPFLQSVLGQFSLVPLLVGDARPDQVADVLRRLWGGPETLIVVSTDLSHYLPYDDACRVDRVTVEHIVRGDGELRGDQACGARALNGALRAAREHGLRPTVLDLRNSGDTAGDRRHVVGYAALAYAEPEAQANVDGDSRAGTHHSETALGASLVATARQAIGERLRLAVPEPVPHPALQRPGASFVTLTGPGDALRGCIGALTASRPLGEDVRHHAQAAAFRDPRFEPLQAEEWATLRIEVSVLAPSEPVVAASESELLARLRPGLDGVVLHWREQRATFLPQVWSQLPDRRDFLSALKRKAGLAAQFWADDIRIERYTVAKYGDAAPA